MATAEPNATIKNVIGTLGKRKKRAYPLTKLDLTMQLYPHSAKLNKKPKPTNKKSKLQKQHRERFKEADCIYFSMTKEQRLTVWQWAKDTGKTQQDKITSYDAFMQAVLKNHCPDLLKDYFCTDITEPTAKIETDKVIVSSNIIFTPQIEEFEGWFERVARRT